MLDSGTALGGYVIESVLRQAGANTLYRARNEHTRELVAVELTAEPGTCERARRLLGTTAEQLSDHPNLVPVTNLIDTDHGTLVVSRLVEGITLSEWLVEHGQPPLELALDLFRDIVRGIAEAHGQGVFHGNLDPTCIIVFEQDGLWRSSVTGFTLPAAARGNASVQTMAGYSAPERAREPETVEAAADLFSLGCILSLLVTGRSPHEPRQAVTPDLRPQRPGTLHRPPKSMLPELAHLIGALTRLDPHGRPPNCVWVLVRLADPVLPPSCLADSLARLSPAAENLAHVPPASPGPRPIRVAIQDPPEGGETPEPRPDEDAGDSDTELEGMVLTADQPTQPPVEQLGYLASDADVWVEVLEDEDSESGELLDTMPTMDPSDCPAWFGSDPLPSDAPAAAIEVAKDSGASSVGPAPTVEPGVRRKRPGAAALATMLVLAGLLALIGLRGSVADSTSGPLPVSTEAPPVAVPETVPFTPDMQQSLASIVAEAPMVEAPDSSDPPELSTSDPQNAGAPSRPAAAAPVAGVRKTTQASADDPSAQGEWVLNPVEVATGAVAEPDTSAEGGQRWSWNRRDTDTAEVPVRIEGNAVRVELVRRGRTHRVPGTVRAGAYQIRAWFDDGTFVDAGEVEVVAGNDNTITCEATQKQCQ